MGNCAVTFNNTTCFLIEDIQSLKQKTAAVVAEVTELISRLENERKDAEEALEFEKKHRKKLYLNSDKLSFWRLQQLPKAVQKGIRNSHFFKKLYIFVPS